MDDNALLELYTSGGDLSLLSDGDLARLHSLIQPRPSNPLGPIAPINAAPSAPSIGQFEPKEFAKDLALRTTELGAGALTGGLSFIPRLAINMAVNAATGAPDHDATGNMLRGGAIEAGGGFLSALPRIGNKASLLFSGARSKFPGASLNELVEPFMRQYNRGIGQGISVGDVRTPIIRRKIAGQSLEALEDRIPGTTSPLDVRGSADELRSSSINSSRPVDVEDALNKDEIEFIIQQIEARDPAGKQGVNQALQTTRPGFHGGSVNVPIPRQTDQALQALRNAGITGPMSVRDTMELGRSQQRAGKSVIQSKKAGDWVLPQDKPLKQAEVERGARLKENAKPLIAAHGELDNWEELNQQLADLYQIEEINRSVRGGGEVLAEPGQLGARGGTAYGTGQNIATLLGLPRAGVAATAGTLGPFALAPRFISGSSNMLGRTGRVAPSLIRALDVEEEIRNRKTKRRRPK